MYSEVSKEKLYFQIVTKLDADKKSKGLRLKKIIGLEDENSLKATFMANSTEEYLKVRQDLEKNREEVSLRGVGKGLQLTVKGENCTVVFIETLSQIKNFEAETEKFVKFLIKLKEAILNTEVEMGLNIKSLGLMEKIANAELEAKVDKSFDKDEFYNKFLNLELDYEFGIIK